MEFEAARQRMERDGKQAIAQAWYTAALSKAGRMPKLETLLAQDDDKGRKQTPRQMKQAIRSMLGGQTVKRG